MCIIPIKFEGSFMNFYEDNKSVTKSIDSAAACVVKYMTEHGLSLSCAESCTGGALAAAVTSVAGASAVFLGGAVTYTEEMKMKLVGVRRETLERFTVYSAETAAEMSEGVRELTGSDFGIGITGIAGPSGGTDEKPVGTVYVSVSGKNGTVTRDLALYKEYEKLDRRSIRELTVLKSLEMLEDEFKKEERNGN
ncbi:CinA family protein [Ruminococcus sp. YE71]|uniref:CinA family protein n=2 Tax=unclassified Ruminococcus TaxID=2608920 RepID=UPI00325A7E61